MDSRELVGESAAGLAETLPDGGALIGLDLGTKTIGIAVCDAGWRFASALKTLPRGKFGRDRDELRKLIEARSIRGIVIGLPRNMDGSEGPRAQSTRQFAANLLGRSDITITFWDERLSTVAVERVLIDEVDLSRRKRGDVVDKMAASYILQGAIDLIAAQRS